MSIFDTINPLEPLLWVNKTPLLTLTYLWHLSQEDIQHKEKSDLLWKLTRQLLIAEHYKNTFPLDTKNLKKQLKILEENEIISSLLGSGVIQEKNLFSILEIQEIYFSHLQNLQSKIIQELSEEDLELRKYYENEGQFERSNVFEVYQCYLEKKSPIRIQSLEELTKQTNKITWLGAFTVEELQEYTSGLYIPVKEEIPTLLSVDKDKQQYLFIEQFHTSYKAPYEKIKNSLIETLAENSVEYELEEEAQKYLEKVPIEYNEKVIKNILELDQFYS